MIILGAKGFAKEILEVFNQLNDLGSIVFFDDVSQDVGDSLYDTFKVVKTLDEAKDYLKNVDSRFALGVGGPKLRKQLSDRFLKAGGELVSVISPKCNIGGFGNTIGIGSSIMTGTVITNDVTLGKGCLINLNCTIGHDSILEDFVELSPNVNISGRCRIGAYTTIGTNAVVIPDVVIGENCLVAAGAVVTRDVPDNCLVAGVPAIVKRELPPLEF